MKKLSVVLATRNEEKHIGDCIKSVKYIADEILIFDEGSEDSTKKIAEKLGAKVTTVQHHDNFHITKQKALEAAKGQWILQLDADERVTPALAKEIAYVISLTSDQIRARNYPKNKAKLFKKHERILRESGKWKDDVEIVAFWIPRLNYFLGKGMHFAGRYPDPAIRLVKNGKARFPMKSVHEFMEIDGATAWLFEDMLHFESPTLDRYLTRLNRYTDLQAKEHKQNNVSLSFLTLLYFSAIKPTIVFASLFFRHKGYKDGMRGFLWSIFSSLHFPISYFKYYAEYSH